ncbi:hypothetical protein E1295_43685 [Nonomuraea mesophila]|uniref:Uncharacterized protein n=1 Tax=Nonomuraea mesophila TaxID=2530382 RepID=A0A4V2Z5Y3_9ACTN|nr:hypothetical protein [Nonomuraea mesophila]TDE26804.1 hypothetical protein E1295_43685 [Nonomuraea mesophila]
MPWRLSTSSARGPPASRTCFGPHTLLRTHALFLRTPALFGPYTVLGTHALLRMHALFGVHAPLGTHLLLGRAATALGLATCPEHRALLV